MIISWRKFENFEMFCPLGAMKLGVQQKKMTASDSVKPRPHIHKFWSFKLNKTFGKQSFRYLSKIEFGQKNFSQNRPRPQKTEKKA